jgi:dephospho-CoA kinase
MTSCQLREEPRPRGRWKHGAIPVIGLIGGIGAGKSLLARRLADRGAAVIDADAVGHELLEDPAIRGRVLERFGLGVLESAGEGGSAAARISRRALAAIVFQDPAARRDLEALLHPAMRERFRRTIGRLEAEGGPPLVVLDAAVLLEASWDGLCDRIAFVDAPRSQRLRRAQEARGWSEETFAARERSQWSVEAKSDRADWIVANDGGPERLDREADRLLGLLHSVATSEVSPAVPLDVR